MLNLNNISWILPFTQRVKAKIRKIYPSGKVYRNASASLSSPCSEGHSGGLSPRICVALKLFTDSGLLIKKRLPSMISPWQLIKKRSDLKFFVPFR
jgi:hypothetical protein